MCAGSTSVVLLCMYIGGAFVVGRGYKKGLSVGSRYYIYTYINIEHELSAADY